MAVIDNSSDSASLADVIANLCEETIRETTTGHIFIDSDQKIIYANNAALNLFVQPRDLLLDRRFAGLITPETPGITENDHARDYGDFLTKIADRLIDGGIEKNAQARCGNNNQIPVGLKFFPSVFDGKTYTCIAVRDRRHELAQSEELRNKNAALEETKVELEKALNNSEIEAARLNTQVKRAQTAEKIVSWLIWAIAGTYSMPWIIGLFGRVPDQLLSLGRDATIFLLGILSTGVGAILGVKIDKQLEPKPIK